MNSKLLGQEPAISLVTRIFQRNTPDVIENMPFLPVAYGDTVLCSVAAIEDCVELNNQLNTLRRLPRSNPAWSNDYADTLHHRLMLFTRTFDALFWECANASFSVLDEYTELEIKGDYKIVAPRGTRRVGPDGLSDSHPHRTFYSKLSKILSGDVLFTGDIKPLGIRGPIVGEAVKPITRQIQYLWQEINSCRQELLGSRPLWTKSRFDATAMHIRLQLLLLDDLCAMALEDETIDFEEANEFQDIHGNNIILVVDEKWHIICVTPQDFQKKCL